MAFVLSLAMVAGLVPAMSGGANKVQAATGSGRSQVCQPMPQRHSYG